MLLAGMDGGEADGNSDGIDAKQAVWFYGAHPKLENFKDKAGTRELCVVSRKKSPRMSPIL